MREGWPRPVAAAVWALLALLAAGTATRALDAWTVSDPPHRALSPGRNEAAERPRPTRVTPLLSPDRDVTFLDLVGAGAPAPRLLALPRGAVLADLLAAAGLPEGLPVEGWGRVGRPLPSGWRLTVRPKGAARLAPMPVARRLRLGLPVDLNVDDAAALATLPGVGPKRAAAIVADRARRGPFASPAALARVRGIGPGTVAGLLDRVTAGQVTEP